MTISPTPQKSGASTLLVVEDNASMRELVRQVLEPLGHRVLLAATCAEARRCWRDRRGAIDLLLTDVELPDGRGPELAAELAAQTPGLAVLIMTGHTVDDLLPGLEPPLRAGVIGKPFDLSDLVARVEELLR